MNTRPHFSDRLALSTVHHASKEGIASEEQDITVLSAARSSKVTAHWRSVCSSKFSSSEQLHTSLFDDFDASDDRARLSTEQSDCYPESEQPEQSNPISTGVRG